jgi:hypothetical protein
LFIARRANVRGFGNNTLKDIDFFEISNLGAIGPRAAARSTPAHNFPCRFEPLAGPERPTCGTMSTRKFIVALAVSAARGLFLEYGDSS